MLFIAIFKNFNFFSFLNINFCGFLTQAILFIYVNILLFGSYLPYFGEGPVQNFVLKQLNYKIKISEISVTLYPYAGGCIKNWKATINKGCSPKMQINYQFSKFWTKHASSIQFLKYYCPCVGLNSTHPFVITHQSNIPLIFIFCSQSSAQYVKRCSQGPVP